MAKNNVSLIRGSVLYDFLFHATMDKQIPPEGLTVDMRIGDVSDRLQIPISIRGFPFNHLHNLQISATRAKFRSQSGLS